VIAQCLVHLQLKVDSNDSSIKTAFGGVFTPGIAVAWWGMLITIDLDKETLASILNKKIRDAFAARIAQDINQQRGAGSNLTANDIQEAIAFGKDPWDTGSGGLHEGKGATITIRFTGDGGTGLPWKFYHGASANAPVFTTCHWIQV
jgi:hypothetical protein